jgi:hypothetical protein
MQSNSSSAADNQVQSNRDLSTNHSTAVALSQGAPPLATARECRASSLPRFASQYLLQSKHRLSRPIPIHMNVNGVDTSNVQPHARNQMADTKHCCCQADLIGYATFNDVQRSNRNATTTQAAMVELTIRRKNSTSWAEMPTFCLNNAQSHCERKEASAAGLCVVLFAQKVLENSHGVSQLGDLCELDQTNDCTRKQHRHMCVVTTGNCSVYAGWLLHMMHSHRATRIKRMNLVEPARLDESCDQHPHAKFVREHECVRAPKVQMQFRLKCKHGHVPQKPTVFHVYIMMM